MCNINILFIENDYKIANVNEKIHFSAGDVCVHNVICVNTVLLKCLQFNFSICNQNIGYDTPILEPEWRIFQRLALIYSLEYYIKGELKIWK